MSRYSIRESTSCINLKKWKNKDITQMWQASPQSLFFFFFLPWEVAKNIYVVTCKHTLPVEGARKQSTPHL